MQLYVAVVSSQCFFYENIKTEPVMSALSCLLSKHQNHTLSYRTESWETQDNQNKSSVQCTANASVHFDLEIILNHIG